MADGKECPLCGGSNNCGVASKQSDCWCMTVKFPKETLIENPTNCICEKCLEQYGERSL